VHGIRTSFSFLIAVGGSSIFFSISIFYELSHIFFVALA
jgi:hypothetical protein